MRHTDRVRAASVAILWHALRCRRSYCRGRHVGGGNARAAMVLMSYRCTVAVRRLKNPRHATSLPGVQRHLGASKNTVLILFDCAAKVEQRKESRVAERHALRLCSRVMSTRRWTSRRRCRCKQHLAKTHTRRPGGQREGAQSRQPFKLSSIVSTPKDAAMHDRFSLSFVYAGLYTQPTSAEVEGRERTE